MILTIYFKSEIGSSSGNTYFFSEEEYFRLRNDFEAYLKEGKPKAGTYVCRPYDESRPSFHDQSRMLEFDTIAFIDVIVRMGKLDKISRQVEEARNNAEQLKEQT